MPPLSTTHHVAAQSLAMPYEWRGRAVRALIFDMDGVIADTGPAHKQAWIDWADRNGLPLDREHFMREFFGRSNLDVLPHFFPDRAHDREFIFRMGEDKEEQFLVKFRAGEIPPLEGFHELVERAVRRSFGLAVGSSAPRRNIETVLAGFNVRHLFPVTVSQQDVPVSKPAPDIFLACIAGLGLQPDECIVLEDSMHGLEAARRAGCHAIGVTTMHSAKELEDHCDLAIADFRELLNHPEWRAF